MEDAEKIWIVFAIVGLAVWVIIMYYFTRWVFSIKRQLWNQKQQINLLIMIAKKLGVSDTDDFLVDTHKRNNSKQDEHID